MPCGGDYVAGDGYHEPCRRPAQAFISAIGHAARRHGHDRGSHARRRRPVHADHRMACIVIAYKVIAYIVVAYIVIAYTVIAYIVIAYIVIAYIVITYIVYVLYSCRL